MSDISLNKIVRYAWCMSGLLLMTLIITPAYAQNQSIKNMLKVKSVSLMEIDSMRHPKLQERLDLSRAKQISAQGDSILLIADSLRLLGVDSLKVLADSLVTKSKALKLHAEEIQDGIIKETNPLWNPIVTDSLGKIGKILTDSLGQMKPDSAVVDSLKKIETIVTDSLTHTIMSLETDTLSTDSIVNLAVLDSLSLLTAKDTLAVQQYQEPTWIPNSSRSVWLALLIPGGGQIYNRKYWKLPIFYGGFAACTYALVWNTRMYHDYQNAYMDLMDDNESTTSYLDLLPANYSYDQSQLETILKNRKDKFRRWRDMSIFAYIGVYFLSVVDAYVDAELSDFDISPDLSMHIEPAVLNSPNLSGEKTVGISCRLTF